MDKLTHVNLVISQKVASDTDSLINKVISNWKPQNQDNITWSITITNRTNQTIEAIKTIVDKLGAHVGKNIYELSYFNDNWEKKKLVNEVFKILPTSVVAEHVWIVSDTDITDDNYVVASRQTIHNIYGLWDNMDDMPMFMKTLRYDMTQKCPTFRTLLHNANDIKEYFNEETWKFFNDKIDRKVVLADVSRYYLMWRRGGFYLDLDVRVNDDLQFLVDKCVREGSRILLFTEHDKCDPEKMGPLEDKELTHRLYNCMFWSLPGEDFWKKCIDLSIKRCTHLLNTKDVWSDVDILWASGPDIITTVYHTMFQYNTKIKIFNNTDTQKLLKHMNGGTWRNNKDKK